MRTIPMLCAAGLLSVGAFNAVKNRILAQAPPAASAAAPVPVPGQPTAIALHADRTGHFHADAVVDGRSLRMVVDTGATLCAFSEEDAERARIAVGPGDFTRAVATANGMVRVAPVRIGSITVRDVEAVVIPRGRLSTNLLGMSFLRRVRTFEIAGGTLTLRG